VCNREGRCSDVHYLICGVQGDFTKSLVENPPTRIWTRELKVGVPLADESDCLLNVPKFAGVSNTSTLYKRGIRVCTGTGLGAALSTCLQVWSEKKNSDRFETNENPHWKNPDW